MTSYQLLDGLPSNISPDVVTFCYYPIPVHKNSESDPSEAKRNRLVAKRNDICGNINLYLV